MITYPLNNVLYSAEDAELYHATRTSGVYAGDDFSCSVSGTDNNIVINEGLAWIRNSKFSGKVVALKSAQTIDLGLPDASFPRIDIVLIQFDANLNETKIVVKKGAASTNPVIPTIVQTEALYELYLYQILRPAASASVTEANITDLRLNSAYCGLMADSVTGIDLGGIEKRLYALLENFEEEVAVIVEADLQEAKNSGMFDGNDGKSAYAYAQDGGYTGTEAEFSAKLAAEYAPPYTYGTEDLEAGVTALETGRLHFVYE